MTTTTMIMMVVLSIMMMVIVTRITTKKTILITKMLMKVTIIIILLLLMMLISTMTSKKAVTSLILLSHTLLKGSTVDLLYTERYLPVLDYICVSSEICIQVILKRFVLCNRLSDVDQTCQVKSTLLLVCCFQHAHSQFFLI